MPLPIIVNLNGFICIVKLVLLILCSISFWRIKKKTCPVEASTSRKHCSMAWFYLEQWLMEASWFQQYLWWQPVVSRWPCKYIFVRVLADARLCCKNCVCKTCFKNYFNSCFWWWFWGLCWKLWIKIFSQLKLWVLSWLFSSYIHWLIDVSSN